MTPKNGGMKMSQTATKEYVGRTRYRYQAMKTRKAKSRVLDEFCATTEYDRKHAIKLLNGRAGNRQRAPGRKRKYDKEVKEVLKRIWMMSDQLCSKLLKPIMGIYLESYERHIGSVTEQTRRKMLQISPATIDRLLISERVPTAKWRRRVRRSAGRLKKEVPVRTGPWRVEGPGWLEADAVPHCGGSMAGDFIWSLTYKDIVSCWTESRAVWNRSADSVKEQTAALERELPFTILGLDVDNGPEFLNWSLFWFCKKRNPSIEFTRSRAYQKNDNAHVEQRNWTHVRQLLGYDRLEDPEMVGLINDLYTNEWSLFKNLFCPSMKVVSKQCVGSRYIKKFDKPKTPCQRLLESEHISEDQKAHLRKLCDDNDPYILRQNMERKLKKIVNYEQKVIQRRAS